MENKNISAIKFENISFSYPGEKECLNDISFNINSGEKVLLLGKNGSGKSTISKLIDGILKPNSGDIYIFNNKMNDDNAPTLREDIGLIFQNPDEQFICSTVKEEIAFGLENRCVDPKDMKDIILDCAKKVSMENYLESEPSNLSGGQKQRVALAAFIALSPKILILDEATAMLDPKGKKDVENIIVQMKKENKDLTIIKISHEMEDFDLYDRIIIVKDNKIFFNDVPSKLNLEIINDAKINIPFYFEIVKQLNSKVNGLSSVKSSLDLMELLCQLKLKN